jgi:hypothetical protein
MDGAYINVFIEKLRNTINDMQSKILLLETDLHFRDLKAAELATQVSDLQTSLDKVSKKAKKVEDNTF